MKKILSIALLTACVFGFANIKNVSATTLDKLNNSNINKVSKENNVYELTLNATTNENLEIQNGENVTLNLNGHTLNNTTTSGDLTVDLPTIKIAEGGTLTITGKGAITRTSKYNESELHQAIISNFGTLNLNLDETANILVSGAADYGIYNQASGILNMTGGRVSTMHKLNYGLWNEGTANISGGRFDQSKLTEEDYADAPAVVNSTNGKLNITGGQFINLTGQEIPTVAPITGSKTTITGGQFEYQDLTTGIVKKQDISMYLSDEYETDRYGNVIKKTENSDNTTTTTPEIQKQPETTATRVENPNTADNILSCIFIGFISLVSLAGCGIYYKKRFQ